MPVHGVRGKRAEHIRRAAGRSSDDLSLPTTLQSVAVPSRSKRPLALLRFQLLQLLKMVHPKRYAVNCKHKEVQLFCAASIKPSKARGYKLFVY